MTRRLRQYRERDACAACPAFDFSRRSCLVSSAASANSHSLNATIFGNFAVAFAQTIQYPYDAGIAISKGRTRRPPSKSHAASAVRVSTTPWPSTAASDRYAGLIDNETTRVVHAGNA